MRLGPYEIGSPLGAGGIGEVYRAHDTKLDRDVAIKILPDAFAADPERAVLPRRTLGRLLDTGIRSIRGVCRRISWPRLKDGDFHRGRQ